MFRRDYSQLLRQKKISKNIVTKDKKIKNKVVNEHHRRLLKRISDNLGNGMNIGEAMRLEGYSKSYSKSPSQLLSTVSWRDLVREQLPDELLAQVHRELLTNENWRARDAGLDKAFKLKGRYKESPVVENKFSHLSREQLEEKVAKMITETLDKTGMVAVEKSKIKDYVKEAM